MFVAGDAPGHAEQVQVRQRDRQAPPQRAQESHRRSQAQQKDIDHKLRPIVSSTERSKS
jgi:hypothetical protein